MGLPILCCIVTYIKQELKVEIWEPFATIPIIHDLIV